MENKSFNKDLLKFVLTGRAFVFIINVILQKAMKEKQIMGPFRELPGGARQQGCKAFRSGAANDEFDGYARYSGTSWPKGKLGGNAGISTLVPLMGREFFLLVWQKTFPAVFAQ